MPFNHIYILHHILGPDIFPFDVSSFGGFIPISGKKLTSKFIYKRPEYALNPTVTWEFVKNHKDYAWNWTLLSKNYNMTPSIVEENLYEYKDDPSYPHKPRWNFYTFSDNPNLTWAFVQAHRDKPWNERAVSCHRNITWDIIENNPDFEWVWEWGVSLNPNITWKNVVENPHRKWNLRYISSNRNITLDVVQENTQFHTKFHLRELAENMDITLSEIEEKRDKLPFKLSWKYLSRNPNITISEIKKTWDKHPWNIEDGIFFNPNLTWKEAMDFLENKKWNGKNGIKKARRDAIFSLSLNPFNRYNAAVKIQRWWRKKRYFLAWKRAIRRINTEILFSPHIPGVEFKRLENCFLEQKIEFRT